MTEPKGKHGGVRPGSGRKPNPKPPAAESDEDALKFLQNVYMDESQPIAQRVRAAVAAVQYTHTRTKDGGKKAREQAQAEGVAESKFGARGAPLKLVNG